MPDPIKPTQADREAAGSYLQDDFHPSEVLAGDADMHWMVQAFALHAQQAREEGIKLGRDQAAEIADAAFISRPDDDHDLGRAFAAEEIAASIRALKEQPPC